MSQDPKQTRQKRSAEMARAAILEAAARVFVRKGHHGATVEEIARSAGYAPSALYKHFRNKADLLDNLWETVSDSFSSMFGEVTQLPLPFAARLQWLLVRASRLLQDQPEIVLAYMAQRPIAAHAVRTDKVPGAYDHYRHHQDQVLTLMEQGISEGALQPREPRAYAMLFVGLLYEFAFDWLTAAEPYPLENGIERFVNIFMHGTDLSGGSDESVGEASK